MGLGFESRPGQRLWVFFKNFCGSPDLHSVIVWQELTHCIKITDENAKARNMSELGICEGFGPSLGIYACDSLTGTKTNIQLKY